MTQTAGSMVSYATVPAWPTSSPAILPTWDRTANLTVNNPTPAPTKLRWLWSFQSKCVYVSPWTCENIIGIEIRKIKNLTFPGIKLRISLLSVSHCDLNHSATLACYLLLKSENINLNGHHHVSHINFRFWNKTRILMVLT